MALRHHERRVATRSAQTLEANVSHDATQSHFPTRLRKSTSRTSSRHTVCPHTGSSPASVSYETSSKSHASRLQDERFVRDFLQKSRVKSPKRFVRDFLQKSHIKSPKRVFRTRLPPKSRVRVKSPKRAFCTRLPPKVKRKHPSEHTHHAAPPSSFAPRNVTCVTPRNLTIPCACHENRTSTLQNPHKVLRLPRKVTISSHVSSHKNLHHTTRLE